MRTMLQKYLWPIIILFLLLGIGVGIVVSRTLLPSPAPDSLPVSTAAPSRMMTSAGPGVQMALNDSTVARAVPVSVYTASRQDLADSLHYHGTLTPKRHVQVMPQVPGMVTSVNAHVGDHVEQGQVLLTIDDEELIISEKQALAAVRAAEANLSRIRSGAREEEIDMARSQVEQAKVNLDQSQIALERVEQLYSTGSVAKSQLEQAQAQYDVALSAYRAAESQLNMITLGAEEQDIEAVSAQVDQAKAALELTRLHLRNTKVTAPISGTIAARTLGEGDYAAPGMPAFHIVQTDPIVLRVEVGGRDVVRLSPGLPATVYTDIYPGRHFEGVVSEVETIGNQMSRLFGVLIDIPNESGMLRSGMAARVDIFVDGTKDAITVPEDAIITHADGRESVYVVSGNRAIGRQVTTGVRSDGRVEIIDGIRADDLVVVSGQTLIEDGDLVDITSVRGATSL